MKEGINFKCLLCNEWVQETTEDGKRRTMVSKLLGGGDERKKEGAKLKHELSTFFLLRKVLGFSTEFLEKLLIDCGSPSEWQVNLCRLCKRLFKETEHVWERMTELQRSYEKVTFQIKDTLVNSISPEEVDVLSSVVDDKTKTAAVEEKLESLQIVEGIRTQFFIDLQNQAEDNAAVSQDLPVPELRSLAAVSHHSGANEIHWSKEGVPFISFAEFENKMASLVKAVTCVKHSNEQSNNLSSSRKDELSNVKHKAITEMLGMDPINSASVNANVVEDYLAPTPQSSSSVVSGSSSRHGMIIEEVKTVPVSLNRDSNNASGEEESLIRIVQPGSIMETEDSDEEGSSDAIPQIIGMLKVDLEEGTDVIDLSTGDEYEGYDDGELPTTDRDDPDYVPDDEDEDVGAAALSSNKILASSSETVKKPKKRPNKFSRLKVQVVKKDDKEFECSKCDLPFSTRLACQIHIFRDHYSEKLLFLCHLCNCRFSNHLTLRQHIITKHKSKMTAYDDDFCLETAFGQQDKEPPHLDDGKFICPVKVCAEEFPAKPELRNHCTSIHGVSLALLKRNHSENPKPDPPLPTGMECELCAKRQIDYRALTPDLLEIHYKKVHNGYVDVRTKIKEKIARQMKSNVPPPKSRPSTSSSMKCPDCGIISPSTEAMVEHIKNPGNKCQLCAKHFMFESGLKHHMEREHNDRSFQCPYCPKSFTAQTIFEKHVQNHQTNDVQECEVCHVRLTGQMLARHMTHAHPPEEEGIFIL